MKHFAQIACFWEECLELKFNICLNPNCVPAPVSGRGYPAPGKKHHSPPTYQKRKLALEEKHILLIIFYFWGLLTQSRRKTWAICFFYSWKEILKLVKIIRSLIWVSVLCVLLLNVADQEIYRDKLISLRMLQNHIRVYKDVEIQHC